MGFSSFDDYTNKVTGLGQTTEAQIFNKITGAAVYAAGRWYDFSMLAGSPVANAWAGTALNWRSCDELTGNGTQIFGLQHSGNVSPATKHATIMGAMTAATTGLGVIQWVDMQGYWPGINMNLNTAQTLIGTPTLRYTNGVGVRPYLVSTVASGATAHNFTMSYTNQANTAGRALGAAVALTASAIAGHISHSGTAANNYGPFLPLAGGDTGVRNVASVTVSAASGAGTAALVLARPIGPMLPISQAFVLSERDLFNQLRSLPRVYDGACLVPMFFASAAVAASTTFTGYKEMAWG
jgi:hypothetical protein